MSNEAKMTLEEKLVQTIKSDSLMALVGDEDAITDLVKRAIHEALYQPTRIPKSYGGFDEADSPVVEATRDITKRAVESCINDLVAELSQDDDFKTSIREAMVMILPSTLHTAITEGARQSANEEAHSVLHAFVQSQAQKLL